MKQKYIVTYIGVNGKKTKVMTQKQKEKLKRSFEFLSMVAVSKFN